MQLHKWREQVFSVEMEVFRLLERRGWRVRSSAVLGGESLRMYAPTRQGRAAIGTVAKTILDTASQIAGKFGSTLKIAAWIVPTRISKTAVEVQCTQQSRDSEGEHLA